MAEEATLATPAVEPRTVEYDPITGVPAEFNEFLPKDCDEYRRWKEARAGAVEAQVAQLAVADDGGAASLPEATAVPAAPAVPAAAEPEKKSSGGKKKKKKEQALSVVLERNTRNKKKCITTITGLDQFGVKLAEASKLFGKKFASGASVTKNPEGQGQIDVQGDFLDQAAELILKQYKEVKRADIFVLENKKKERYFDEEEDEDDAEGRAAE